jgi:uncharacterized lipoprotein YbaY
VLVSGAGQPETDSIVASQLISPTGQQPIAFAVEYQTADIDPAGAYTIQAQIEDGDRIWTTAAGVPVPVGGEQAADLTVELVLRST